nr:immunoglobulin light chain junction region [Macaca mulatta]MPO00129.1 immunoglobulin light chain junction region [Macaca mulatta]
YQQYNSLPFTF